MGACVFRVGVSVFRRAVARPLIFFVNPIQLGTDTQAFVGLNSAPASSFSTALVVGSTTPFLDSPAAEVPSPPPLALASGPAKARAVPFSCFKVLCNFVLLFRVNFRGL